MPAINWRRPILKFYDGHIAHNPIPEHVASLNEFHTWPAARRRQVQAERLSRLLLHAGRHVPHYRDVLLGAGVVRGNDVDFARFQNIPELTRELLHDAFERLTSDDLASRAWYRNTTGGSTGKPVVVLQDRPYYDIGEATTAMHYTHAGWQPGEPFVRLWGSERDFLVGTLGWRNKLSNFVRNQTFLNSWAMSPVQMQRYVETIQRVRPVVIEAYAESAYELARFINDAGIRISGVRRVITSAGTLYPFIREEVERAFGCPVLNRYGSREVGNIAGEKVSGAGLEVFAYTHLVEVVDEHGRPCSPGEEGDVLITCLTNYAMPIIRYRIGDQAAVSVTISTPTPSVEQLQTVTGRVTDTFIREDGSTVAATFFIHFLGVVHNSGWLRKTQVIQQDYNAILIKMVTATPPPAGALDEIRTSFQRVMGAACRVDFECVDVIPPLPSGKYRYTVSLVPRPQSKGP